MKIYRIVIGVKFKNAKVLSYNIRETDKTYIYENKEEFETRKFKKSDLDKIKEGKFIDSF